MRKTLLRATGDTYTLKWISWSESKKQAVHWYFTGDLHNGYRVSPISSGGDLRLVHSSGLGKRNPEARSQCIQYELLRAPNRHWLRGKKRGRKSSQDERKRAMLYYLNERRCGLRVERFFFFRPSIIYVKIYVRSRIEELQNNILGWLEFRWNIRS